jgi:hypothetical protein
MGQDETEYLTSSTANKKRLEKSIKDFEKSDLTPFKLLAMGFEEVYHEPEIGQNYMATGYIYYSLEIAGIAFLSTATDEPEFFVFLDDNTKITSIESLRNLVLSLRDL